MLKNAFLILSSIIFLNLSTPVLAANAPGCSCWRWGYKAGTVKLSKDNAQKTKFFKMCSGETESGELVGSESNYWEGYDAGLNKAEMICPYTDESKDPT